MTDANTTSANPFEIDFLAYDVKWTLGRVEEFAKAVENWVRDFDQQEWDRWHQRTADVDVSDVPEDQLEAEMGAVADEIEYRTDAVTRTFRYSTVAMLFSSVETGLRLLSRVAMSSSAVPFAPHELRESDWAGTSSSFFVTTISLSTMSCGKGSLLFKRYAIV